MGFGGDQAETLALQALAWLAGDEDLLGAFLAASGLGPHELMARAGEPEVLAAVMDFILAEDGRVGSFCATAGLACDRLAAVRAALPGGDAPAWT